MILSRKHRILRALGHQLWLPGRDRLLRLFADPDRHPSVPFEVDFYGMPYVGNMNDFIDWTVFYSGAFVPHELMLLKDLAAAIRARGKPVNFYDVGANIGHHTLFMTQHSDHVFAFEPFAAVRERMVQKLCHAEAANVTIFPVALGDEDGMGSYRPPVGANQATGTLSGEIAFNASEQTIEVAVGRADRLLPENGAPPISLLKMDVEGYEVKVLAGMRETLRRDRPPILMEIWAKYVDGIDKGRMGEVKELLYPDHLLFSIDSTRGGQYLLKPFSSVKTNEALVLPGEMAGLLAGT